MDEALLDASSVDFEILRAVTREHCVGIEEKTNAKNEAEGHDPSVTYALVDENDEVTTVRRIEGRATARKLAADYTWSSLHNTMNERMMREQDFEDVQRFEQNGEQLDAALNELRQAEQDRGLAPRLSRVSLGVEQETDEHRAGDDHSHERVEIVDADLGGIVARLVCERRERDQAERRLQRDHLRAGSVLDDEADPQRAGDDDFELG